MTNNPEISPYIVYFVLPARRSIKESTIPAWEERGYRVVVATEWYGEDVYLLHRSRIQFFETYPGWARSVNALIHMIAIEKPWVRWFVLGGDDTLPDPTHTPEEIAAECEEHFSRDSRATYSPTFGVMQPTGDDWCDHQGRMIERVAGSAWIGRDFALASYRGGGPLYPAYFHNFADEELQEVAGKLGVFWQRRDLTHRHNHWARPRGLASDMPAWAAKIHSPEDWKKSSAIFQQRKAAGFPGHEILEGYEWTKR